MTKKLLTILSLILALDISIASSLAKVYPHLQIHALDVGQGDAILITTPEQHHILVDGGPGNAVLTALPKVLPYLFGEIDLMILTHPHADHVNGLIPILDRMKVKAVLLAGSEYESEAYAAFLKKISDKKIPVYIADDQRDFKLGDTMIDVLFPFENIGEIDNVNNASVVMKITNGEDEILLSGDAEIEEESQLLGLDLDADILKAGHHGSRTSSTTEFLSEVSPEIMIISSGEGNDYGHPHSETLEKAEDFGIEVLRTDTQGNVSIIFDDQSWIRSIFAPSWRSFTSSSS
jgi:competence protein ComEC